MLRPHCTEIKRRRGRSCNVITYLTNQLNHFCTFSLFLSIYSIQYFFSKLFSCYIQAFFFSDFYRSIHLSSVTVCAHLKTGVWKLTSDKSVARPPVLSLQTYKIQPFKSVHRLLVCFFQFMSSISKTLRIILSFPSCALVETDEYSILVKYMVSTEHLFAWVKLD